MGRKPTPPRTDEQELVAHPAADIFPMLDDKDLKVLAADIKANGLINPIVKLDGKILDGRNRYRACRLAGVEPRFVDGYKGAMDPLTYVISTNLHRRHLSESQRAMIAARYCKNSDSGSRTAAELLNVSHQTVCIARKVLDFGDAETIAKVDRGEMSLNRANQRVIRTDAHQAPPLPDGKFDVILADPPWHFSNSDSGFGSAPESHYPTMQTQEICAMGVRAIASDRSVLFLWACSGMLPDALEVMSAWGFEYKSSIIWFKPNHTGMGYYVRTAHELLLIGTRGSMLPDAYRPESVVTAPRGEHSEKPAEFYDLIEQMYPGQGVRRVELFARGTRAEWKSWGNAVESPAPAELDRRRAIKKRVAEMREVPRDEIAAQAAQIAAKAG
jgi:N6-adenosine-specific RNA methylase IME4